MNIYKKIGSLKDKQVLLLQGPMGNFFARLDKKFSDAGANTYRIGLNAGDEFFSHRDNYTPFKGKMEDFRFFINNYYKENSIDMVFIFGDCRYYQSIAIKEAKKLGVKVFVFEEGYVRPNYITLEKDGVNAYSSLPKNRDFYDVMGFDKTYEKDVITKKTNFFKLYWQSSLYFIVANLFKFKYPYYKHHRNFSVKQEFFYGCRSFYRKIKYRLKENGFEVLITKQLSKKYFFVPLQTHGDFQIITHSKYNTIEEFILEILKSFAKYSKDNNKLIFKHHPVDRGRCDYGNFIKKHSKILNCEDKIMVVYDVHLPTLLKHTKGTIVVNSTVGLSSLYHYTPTLCMGEAIYDIDGLTSQSTLDEFWSFQPEVDKRLFNRYRCYLIENTQVNDIFY